MRKIAFLFFFLPILARAGDIEKAVWRESSVLSVSVFGREGGILKDAFYIPWNEPTFQFWKSYYASPANRAKLLMHFKNFSPFYGTVKEILREEGLPEDLAFLAIVESNGNPGAVSRAGAGGLWQLMPGTARLYRLKVNRYIDERFDVVKSTRVAVRYLKYLYELFGRWDLAIAAYNAGPGAIKKRLEKLGAERFWDLRSLPDETLNYVPRFYALLSTVKEEGLRIPEDRGIVKIKVLSRTSLYTLSRKLHIPYRVLKYYNPQFRRRIVFSGYTVYVPVEYAEKAGIPDAPVYVYVPRRREKITRIARRFGVDASDIKRINRLKRSVVNRGQFLLIVKREREGAVVDERG